VIDWLMRSDPAIQRLVSKYLLDAPMAYSEKGMLDMYLSAFDSTSGLWGGGVYGPKWISTHYTLRELKYLEVEPNHSFYLQGLESLLAGEWRPLSQSKPHVNQDVCVVAMILSLACYARLEDERIGEMLSYLFERQFTDGGWNCSWNSARRPAKKSSLHTTLTVLEAFFDYKANGYKTSIDQVEKQQIMGEEFVLRKNLLRSERTGEIIHPDFTRPHYPTRWKYDSLRALEYFARSGHPYDERMKEALDLLRDQLRKGPMPKGVTYTGKVYFSTESPTGALKGEKGGRFNTFRALLVLKHFDQTYYRECLQKGDKG